jgi:hypothetical protein
MNQTAETAQTEQLLRDLIATYTPDENGLQITIKEHPGRVNFFIKVSAAAMPLLCGKRGILSKPLIFLAEEIGRNSDKFMTLAITDPDPGPSAGRLYTPPADTWDPDPTIRLLERLLEAVGVGEFHVEHIAGGWDEIAHQVTDEVRHADGRLNNVLVIWVRGDDDFKLLTVPPTMAPGAQPVITALGTLFRAGANKTGIRMHLQVTKVP